MKDDSSGQQKQTAHINKSPSRLSCVHTCMHIINIIMKHINHIKHIAILRKCQKNSEKYARLYGFFQKMAPKSPQIFITFSDTY